MLFLKLFTGALVFAPAMAMAVTGIEKKVTEDVDFPAGFHTVASYNVFDPGVCSGRHSHPGLEIGYVIEGEITMKTDGQPDKTYKPGDTIKNAPEVVHNTCNTSTKHSKLFAVHVLDKTKPPATPAK